MDTFFNNLNQNLSTECLLLQILLNAGYPADTPAIGSSPNKEDELPMLRDFKASVKSLKRFFPEDTDIDSTEMGKLIFMLYHHCIISATDSFRSLGYWTDTNNVTALSRMDSPMGLEEMLHNGKFETDPAGNFVGANTKKTRLWKDICCSIPATPESNNKAKVLRQNATYIMARMQDDILGGCINNMIGWYRDFPLSGSYQFYYTSIPLAFQGLKQEDYIYSFPAVNTDIAYDILYNYRGYATAWLKFLDEMNDDSTNEQDALKGTSRLYRHHQRLDFHTKEANPLDDILFLSKMETNFSIAYIPQIIHLRHTISPLIEFPEVMDQILMESLDLGNGLYRLDLLTWALRNYLGIAYNATSGEVILMHAEKNTTENAAAALAFIKTCRKILFPVAERLFFQMLYNRISNYPNIQKKDYCRQIYQILGNEICGKYHRLYLTRITEHSDEYTEFFNALHTYFFDPNSYPFSTDSDMQSVEDLIKACQHLESSNQPVATGMRPPKIEEKSRKSYEDWLFVTNVFVSAFSSLKSSERIEGFITPDRLGFGVPADKQTKQQRSDLQNHIDQFLLS